MLIHLDLIQYDIWRESKSDITFLPQNCSMLPVLEIVTEWTSVPFMQDLSLSLI